jgi:D-alanyl-D-alanine carboxypeptidase
VAAGRRGTAAPGEAPELLGAAGALLGLDTIGERLSDLREPPPATWSNVTLRQLLNHTSGLPDYSGEAFRTADEEGRLRHPDPPEKLLTYAYGLNNGDLLFDPGSRYQYSNSDNVAVALMIEDATGGSYEDQLKQLVYRPLGLSRTSLPVGPELTKPFIHGYDLSESPPEDGSEILAAGWAWASGGIVSTPADLNAFIRGYVGSDLFDLQTRAEQREVFEGGGSELPGPGENSAGLGRLPLRDGVRDGVGPHGQHPRRLHPVLGGESQRAPLGDCVHKRADHPDRGRSGGLRGAQTRGGSGRVRGARGKGIGE